MITEADVQGHWVRTWIKAPGFEDHSTRVHWIQCGLDYADVRIPLERPDLTGSDALADLDASALAMLAKAEGFAGHVTLDGTHCTWHREVNWHGRPDMLDIGAISFEADGNMIEAGVLADYRELWAPSEGPPGAAMRFSGGGYSAILATHGDSFVLGIGRTDKLATAPLVSALNAGDVPGDVTTLFDGLHAFGTFADGTATAVLATNPFVEGSVVTTWTDTNLTWHREDFDGTRASLTLNRDA